MSDERLKLAVFIDFDNIEIGVKTTLGVHFDIGAILEAIKERGEVITKVAYGDWKRAGDHSRLLTQHAIRMVQRNVTPGGDKNGADINLALDALEMALTHDHINAYVIVGGDSDFISLVEKLKQYDKKVFVVGGRAFTSVIMQKNCYEFIAYENLIAPPPTRRSSTQEKDRTGRDGARLSKAVPLVARALQVLTDREVSPQLGLLKSTLLQLDSAFSERDYGAGSFREFVEKLAQAGYVNLKQTGRSVLVELNDTATAKATPEAAEATTNGNGQVVEPPVAMPVAAAAPQPPSPPAATAPSTSDAEAEPEVSSAPQPPLPSQTPIEAVQMVRRLFEASVGRVRWPMYVRNVKQFLRAADATFDERRFGFGGILDLLRACQREGIFRLERDRQGVLRVFPGAAVRPVEAHPAAAAPSEAAPVVETEPAVIPEIVAEPENAPEVVEAEVLVEKIVEDEPQPAIMSAPEGGHQRAEHAAAEEPTAEEQVGEEGEKEEAAAPAAPRTRRRRATTTGGARKTTGGARKRTAPTTTRARGRKRSE